MGPLRGPGSKGSEGSEGSEGKVLRMDRPRGRRVLKFDGAFGPEGCGGALRAMSIKSALRDWLSASYSMLSILVIGSLRSPPKGETAEWYMKYMTLCFSPQIPRFPLRGTPRRGKGCTGQSTDLILYRYPDRQSAAPLAASWSSPPCKQVALVLISAVVKVFHKRAPSINVRRPPQPSAAKPLSVE